TPVPVCGNGIREGDESCDSNDFGRAKSCCGAIGGDTCSAGGTLQCTRDCKFDLSECLPAECSSDENCYVDVDCETVVTGCTYSGICDRGYCITSQPVGDDLVRICTAKDPRDKKPRCQGRSGSIR